MILLIHPPVIKPCEPPPGVARLSGFLKQNGMRCRVLDANLEGLLCLMSKPLSARDRWTSRALSNFQSNLSLLREPRGYSNFDRYKRAVMDLNRLLEMSQPAASVRIGLANYQDTKLSAVHSSDLIQAAENPATNPFYDYFSERLQELIGREGVSVVGFSLNFLSQALTTFAMLGLIRREHPGVSLILGGGLVTSWLRKPDWQNPFAGLVDHLVAGPGETQLRSILGMEQSPSDWATPDYGALPLDGYLAPGLILPYSASSGCYWSQCSFCPERAEGNPYLPVPTEQAIAEISALVANNRPILLHLLDNAVSPALLSAMTDHIPGVPWYGFVRISRQLADLDYCVALKRAGCVMLKLGLESGDQGVLDAEHKGVDLEVASAVLKTLKKAGIATYVYLLFGTPAETLLEARRTLDFTAKHGNEIGCLNLAIFNLPIHGPESAQLETRELSEGDLSLYTGFSHPAGWHKGLVRQYLDKEFKRHPAIAPILRRDPPIFTSNHAPFFQQRMA